MRFVLLLECLCAISSFWCFSCFWCVRNLFVKKNEGFKTALITSFILLLRKNCKIFPCGAFLWNFWRHVYRSALISRNLPCPEKVLVARLYNTKGSTNQMLIVPQIQTTHYGEHSFKSRSINAWNLYQRNLKTDLITCDFAKLKKLIFQYHLNQYQLWVQWCD